MTVLEMRLIWQTNKETDFSYLQTKRKKKPLYISRKISTTCTQMNMFVVAIWNYLIDGISK